MFQAYLHTVKNDCRLTDCKKSFVKDHRDMCSLIDYVISHVREGINDHEAWLDDWYSIESDGQLCAIITLDCYDDSTNSLYAILLDMDAMACKTICVTDECGVMELEDVAI